MLFGATYAIRFAVQDDVTEELERALELHLNQCYVPLSTATGSISSPRVVVEITSHPSRGRAGEEEGEEEFWPAVAAAAAAVPGTLRVNSLAAAAAAHRRRRRRGQRVQQTTNQERVSERVRTRAVAIYNIRLKKTNFFITNGP